jgi:hypothetical protein
MSKSMPYDLPGRSMQERVVYLTGLFSGLPKPLVHLWLTSQLDPASTYACAGALAMYGADVAHDCELGWACAQWLAFGYQK